MIAPTNDPDTRLRSKGSGEPTRTIESPRRPPRKPPFLHPTIAVAKLACRHRSRIKAHVESLFALPVIVSPSVCGQSRELGEKITTRPGCIRPWGRPEFIRTCYIMTATWALACAVAAPARRHRCCDHQPHAGAAWIRDS
jgi:hypothetical protein